MISHFPSFLMSPRNMSSQLSSIIKHLKAYLTRIQLIPPKASKIILTLIPQILSKINPDLDFLPKKLLTHLLPHILDNTLNLLDLSHHLPFKSERLHSNLAIK